MTTKILGPIGLRAITRRPDGTFGSPIYRFSWSRSGIETAAVCGIGSEIHHPPRKGCSCGLYIPKDWFEAVRHRQKELTEYTIYTLCIGLGEIEEHEFVYRCQQTAILGLVNMDEDGMRLKGARYNELVYAQNYFSPVQVSIYSLNQAKAMIEYQRKMYEAFIQSGDVTVLENYHD